MNLPSDLATWVKFDTEKNQFYIESNGKDVAPVGSYSVEIIAKSQAQPILKASSTTSFEVRGQACVLTNLTQVS
jgi:hypothetical protein